MQSAGAQRLKHIIVIMLENRSFDHLLGYLKHPNSAFDGITLDNGFNPRDPAKPAGRIVRTSMHSRLRLRADPDHTHAAVMSQLCLDEGGSGEPTNKGFVKSYRQKATDEGPGTEKARRWRRRFMWMSGVLLAVALVALLFHLWLAAAIGGALAFVMQGVRHYLVPPPDDFRRDGNRIMWCWDPRSVRAISDLALGFAVCTRWFSSVPGETWPNRQFAHAGTSAGTVDINVRLYRDETIFEQLEAGMTDPKTDWRIYYDGPAQVLCYPALWETSDRIARWFVIQELFDHIEEGNLPAYTFVEPNHGYIGRSYSQHPGNNRRRNDDFRRGDRFVAAVYEALRRNPELFEETLLVVTYDEHGGTFDHVPPPVTVSPDGRKAGEFDFTRYGPRVPAILVSPWIPEQLVVADKTFDHSSILASVREQFLPGSDPLHEREKCAETFLHALSLSTPRTPDSLPNLSRRAWRPKAAWSPVQIVQGWLRGLGTPMDESVVGLAKLSQLVDEPIPDHEARAPDSTQRDVVFRPRAPRADLPIPPTPPNRPQAAQAMRRFGDKAASARGTG